MRRIELSEAHRKKMNHEEAAVAILHARSPAEAVLLMRRAERESDPWSGHWSFPGGRRDPADQDLLHTALRELQEESGVRLLPSDLAAEFPPRMARRKSGVAIPVTPFLFRTNVQLEAVPDGREAAETAWIPLSLLRDADCHLLDARPRPAANPPVPRREVEPRPALGLHPPSDLRLAPHRSARRVHRQSRE